MIAFFLSVLKLAMHLNNARWSSRKDKDATRLFVQEEKAGRTDNLNDLFESTRAWSRRNDHRKISKEKMQ